MRKRTSGFTLIELSIVLVIIGLVIGGILVGQELINAAAIRAQVTQIEKYQTAVNTFRSKYNNQIPGDMNLQTASMFGFTASGRGGFSGADPGSGDGNGILEGGVYEGSCNSTGWNQGAGETAVFWNDLSQAGLIDGSFNTAIEWCSCAIPTITGSGFNAIFPQGKIGGGNYVYVWNGGINYCNNSDDTNYFGLTGISSVYLGWGLNPLTALSVAQAYAIDKKIDDGFPQSGTVIAYAPVNGNNNGWAAAPTGGGRPPGWAGAGSTTCYDNGGNASLPAQYSMEIASGTNLNCWLSFRFQ